METNGKKDVIIVLGGGINQDGSLPRDAEKRVEWAAHLFKEGIAPNVVMSGAYGFPPAYVPPKTEAKAMKEYAARLGVPEKAVELEEGSRDTVGNIVLTFKDFVKPRGWQKITVVTSAFHVPRARFLCDRICGPEQISFEGTDTVMERDALRVQLEKELTRIGNYAEIFNGTPKGDYEAWHQLLRERHPAYSNGH